MDILCKAKKLAKINNSKTSHANLALRSFIFLAVQLSLPAYSQSIEIIDDIFYDVVNIKVDAPTYDTSKPPVFARIKYNKLCPIVLTSDDMGTSDFVVSWAFFNGYPTFNSDTYIYISKGDDFFNIPYNSMEYSQQIKELKCDNHQPLTYSDGTGGIRRFTATSAIWPNEVNGTNYMRINGNDAKTMIRTGWSFAQHDVDAGYATDYETIASRFKILSNNWKDVVGIGLKIMVEPGGNHNYIDAGKKSEEICWNIFQNGKLPNYPEVRYIKIDDWTTGKDWTAFDYKPDSTTARFFFQDKEEEFQKQIDDADGSLMILGGSHGFSPKILKYLKNIVQPSDKFWVAGADEVWEYYHLYNKSKITDISYKNGVLSFNVKIPRYKKHQFRELTINIPGITEGTSYSLSDNAITGGGRQNTGYYTINLGMEDRIYSYIEELITYYRAHQYNQYVKDDTQYLIDLLLPGEKKNYYQAMLDAKPAYCTYQVSTSIGDIILTSGAQDIATPVTFSFPRYILNGTELYESTPNEVEPYYTNTFTPDFGENIKTINYQEAINNVVYFNEGENLDNAQYHPIFTKNIENKKQNEYYVYHWSSGAAGGIINDSATITTLQPGSYTLTIAVGASNENEDLYTEYKIKLGNNTIYSFKSDKIGINEYETNEIIVNEPQTLTIETGNANPTRWIDYLYIQKKESETSIFDIPKDDSDSVAAPTYNIMGMKTNKNRKGIYISKGKKFIIR